MTKTQEWLHAETHDGNKNERKTKFRKLSRFALLARQAGIRLYQSTLKTDVWFGNNPKFAAQMGDLLALRYQIYVAELGKQLPLADHKRKILPDIQDDTAWHLLVRNWLGKPLGCVRLHIAEHLSNSLLAPMQLLELPSTERARTGYVSKLMVTRSARGLGAALLLMQKMAWLSKQLTDGLGDCALFHCNPKLVSRYERVGFRVFGRPFTDTHVGAQVPMVYLLADLNYLTAIRSPLAHIAKSMTRDAARIAALYKRYLQA